MPPSVKMLEGKAGGTKRPLKDRSSARRTKTKKSDADSGGKSARGGGGVKILVAPQKSVVTQLIWLDNTNNEWRDSFSLLT